MVVTPSTMVALGTSCPDFSLPNVDGGTVSRADFAGKPLVVGFICNHCPYVVHIADRWSQVGRHVQDEGVGVVAISSNSIHTHPEDGPDAMVEEAKARGYAFPYLYDESQEVARAFDAACTPDFFVYDGDHRLVYRGQFDGARPGNGMDVTGESLLAAVHAMQKGEVLDGQQPSMGCNIKWHP